jgi:hypothetical protein
MIFMVLYRADSLLNRTGNIGEHIIRVRADQSNGAYDDYENYGQHYGVFGYILSFVLAPQSPKMMHSSSS